MNLSSVPVRGVFVYRGRRGIVVSKDEEEHPAAQTVVHWEGSGHTTYFWFEDDPDVKFVGLGRRATTITLDGE